METRRSFIKKSLVAGAGLMVAPTIIPSHVMGKNAPSDRINVGAIGTGRISRVHDIPDTIKYDYVRITAVSDLDIHRAEEGRQLVEAYYTKQSGQPYSGVRVYQNYTDLLADKDVDAVLVSTPDHWHAKIAIDAARARKHIYLQKPTSLTIGEGRKMSNAVNANGVVLQIGSQQRSMTQFRVACELVRNGRIGRLQRIEVRLPGDPPGGNPEEMPVPKDFNYDMWLGQTPWVPYTVDRVHPQTGYDRPGWLRCEQFGAGMITGWGAHHFDIAHWAMDTEYSGPIEISGTAEFPSSGLWDVHGTYETEMRYANGVVVAGITESPDKPNGLLFTGSHGWLFVSRGAYTASPSDPISTTSKALQDSDAKILAPLTANDPVRLAVSLEHHGNWLESIRTGAPNITPAEVAHRSNTVCLLQHIAMKLGRKLYWDPVEERFLNDDAANSMIARPHRYPYNF